MRHWVTSFQLLNRTLNMGCSVGACAVGFHSLAGTCSRMWHVFVSADHIRVLEHISGHAAQA